MATATATLFLKETPMTDHKPPKQELKFWWIEDATPEPELTTIDKLIVVALALIFAAVVFYAGWQSFGFLWSFA